MADASSSGNEGTLATYMEKTDKLSDLVLKLLQKISGNESSPPEREEEEHMTDNGRRKGLSSPRREMGSDGSNQGEYVTKEELMGLLNDRSTTEAVNGFAFQPPYPREIQAKPYPRGYHPPAFRMYNGRTGNAREHIIQFIDDLGVFSHDPELRMREFSKSLRDRAYS